MKKLNSIIQFFVFLFPILLFLSYKGVQTLSYIILLFFILQIINKNNRVNLISYLDKKISVGLLIFIATPFIISIFSGGIMSRSDNYIYLYLLMFFPLVYFINSEKKFFLFLKFLFGSAIISLTGALIFFITIFKEWANPKGFYYPRIQFILPTQDFANIMCIFFLFMISFLLFYKNENKKIKITFLISAILAIFILLVNRSKMVYICLFPSVIYILWEKNKKYILSFISICFVGYFFLPKAISERLQYIIKFDKDPSSRLRVLFWESAIASFKKSPLFGMTTKDRVNFNLNHFKNNGTLEYIANNYEFKVTETGIVNTHNMYLHYLAYYGIGIFSLIYFLFIVIPSRLLKINYLKNNFNDTRFIALEVAIKSSFIAYLIQNLTEINLNKKIMVFVFTIILFIINYIYKKQFSKN